MVLYCLRREEARELGLPNSIGNFNEMFEMMEEMISTRRLRKSDIGSAGKMSNDEKKISFLNKYFVFKKIRDVDANQVSRILTGQSEAIEISDVQESIRLQKAAVGNLSKTKKVKKLNRKLKLKQTKVASDTVDKSSKKKTHLKIKKGVKIKN